MHNTAQDFGRARGLQAGSLGPVPHTLPHRPPGDDPVLSPCLTGTGAIPPHRLCL